MLAQCLICVGLRVRRWRVRSTNLHNKFRLKLLRLSLGCTWRVPPQLIDSASCFPQAEIMEVLPLERWMLKPKTLTTSAHQNVIYLQIETPCFLGGNWCILQSSGGVWTNKLWRLLPGATKVRLNLVQESLRPCKLPNFMFRKSLLRMWLSVYHHQTNVSNSGIHSHS